MSEKRMRIIAAVVVCVIVVVLVIFQRNAVSDDFFRDFGLEDISDTKRVFVYNDFDGLPAAGTSVYKYELEERIIDTGNWNSLPFDIEAVSDCLEKADVEIENAYYIYNESDRNEDNDNHFDIAILDMDSNVLYHVLNISAR